MLKQRVITALILVGVIFASLASASPWPFALLMLLLVAAGAWEWGRLNQAGDTLSLVFGLGLAAFGALAMVSGWPQRAGAPLWWLATGLWVLLGTWTLKRGVAAWARSPSALRWLVGMVLLVAAWAALTQVRALGINFLISTLCVVWMADVAAYFGGKAFGRRKLAPAISPGKSWEGVWSGMAGVLVLAGVWVMLDRQFAFDGPSLYTLLVQRLGWALTVLVLLMLCALSVMGDLIESLVKRAADAKDSSRLLPGHGGVLDRVDALLPVLPAVLALTSVAATGAAP